MCPPGVLLSDDAEELSMSLQRYVVGTRKTSGEKYPPRTLHMLLSGLQRHMREQKDLLLRTYNIVDCMPLSLKFIFLNFIVPHLDKGTC